MDMEYRVSGIGYGIWDTGHGVDGVCVWSLT